MDREIRFWSKVDFGEQCWLWTASADKYGRGHFRDRNQVKVASRAAFELAVGPIPSEMNVLHKCDVPACVRPSHLFLGTQFDNVADCRAKGRFVQNHRTKKRVA